MNAGAVSNVAHALNQRTPRHSSSDLASIRLSPEKAQAMDDLRAAGVHLLTLGQYLRPTANHLSVREFVHPDRFAAYRQLGLDKGFVEVVAGPLVRSSYRAERALEGNNAGLLTSRPAG